MRVSPPKVFGEAVAAGKPPAGSAGAQDAYRQTGFVLGAEVDLVVSGLALEGQVADASSGAKFRTQVTASALGLWSRSWLSRLQALHALQWGNYTAAMPLVRAAADSCVLLALLCFLFVSVFQDTHIMYDLVQFLKSGNMDVR